MLYDLAVFCVLELNFTYYLGYTGQVIVVFWLIYSLWRPTDQNKKLVEDRSTRIR